jgi:hypothetical protein
MELIGSVVVAVPADLYATCMNQFRVVWGRRYKLSSTAVARLPQGNLRSAVARSDEGLTGCRTWSYAVIHCSQFNRLQDRGVVVLRLVYARRDRPHPHQFGRAWQARLCGCRLGPRIKGEGMVTGRGCPRIVSWGVTSVGSGSRPVGDRSYTDMVNELLRYFG